MRDAEQSSRVRQPPRHRSHIALTPHHHSLAGVLGVAALISTLIVKPPLIFVWNASSSVPRGLYVIKHSGKIRRGQFVLAWLAHPWREFADQRRYVPANVPILKKVVGVAGDRACGNGAALGIDRSIFVSRLSTDLAGRHLPSWNACRRLSASEIFLLGSSRLSFDGRYFGPTHLQDIEGRAVPVWTQ